MRLTAKLVILITLGTTVFTAIYASMSISRAERLIEEEMQEKAIHLAKAMQDEVRETWRTRGHDGVAEMLRSHASNYEEITMRWVRPDVQPGHRSYPNVPTDQLREAAQSMITLKVKKVVRGKTMMYSCFPIGSQPDWVGFVEVSEAMDEVKTHTRGTMIYTGGLILLNILCGLFVVLVGVRLIGRPLDQLIVKTRRIGRGDFAHTGELKGTDELAELESAMNQMCDQLDESSRQIQAESAARLATVEQLRHVDRLKTVGRLASGLAHEMGTPLNVISGRADLISSGRLKSKDVARSAETIKEQSTKMTAIIRQLLDFARRSSPQATSVDLRNIVDQAVELLSPLASKNSVEVERIKPRDAITANVDAGQIQQVLTNLIVNAIQEMPNGGNIQIQLTTERARAPDASGEQEKDYAVISVSDSGPGISPEHIDHIFEPFYTTKDVGEGTGLGLSVSYGITEDHGGWIAAHNEPDGGSCFKVYLPCNH